MSYVLTRAPIVAGAEGAAAPVDFEQWVHAPVNFDQWAQSLVLICTFYRTFPDFILLLKIL